MKKTFIPVLVAAALLATVTTTSVWAAGVKSNAYQSIVGKQRLAGQGRQGWGRGAGGNQLNDGTCSILSVAPAQADPLTATQAEDLAFMWREEMLARDVYAQLAETLEPTQFCEHRYIGATAHGYSQGVAGSLWSGCSGRGH